MNRKVLLASLLALVCLAQRAIGHGDAIQINQSDGRLTVSHVLNNFPPLVFGENDADGQSEEDITFLPAVGEIVLWELPGLEINGLSDASSLSIEPRVRPVVGSPTNETRLVWYWNPATDIVEPSYTDLHLLGTAPRFTTLSATNAASPGPFLLADPLDGQQEFHNHGLLKYALDNDPTAPTGVYGFFARFVSNDYEPSDEFLIVLNNGASFSDVVPAAAAIVAAATFLPGDFNHDGTVDAADYTVWRDGSLGPEKYAEWKTNFGQSIGSSGRAANSIATVPEPASLVLTSSVLAWGACIFVRPLRRQGNLSPRPQHSI